MPEIENPYAQATVENFRRTPASLRPQLLKMLERELNGSESELSKCSYVTIWRAVANEKLKTTTIGNQPRILGSWLLEWIEAGGETGRSKATM